jgi:hypothetical protein
MIFLGIQIIGLKLCQDRFFFIDQLRRYLISVTGTRNPLNNAPDVQGDQHFSLQKIENRVTLLVRVISQGYGGLAQPAKS